LANDTALIPVERIDRAILVLRGQKVILDTELAALYEVETKMLNRAVKRNSERFPADFMFQLTKEEYDVLRCHSGTSNVKPSPAQRSQSGTSESRGGRRYLPYAFTEQGVAMLSSVLHSERAVRVNIEIMRAFVRLRRMLQANAELSLQLDALEKRYDHQFKIVFDAIRELMEKPKAKERRIGFRQTEGSKK